jgi:hypothetical protein
MAIKLTNKKEAKIWREIAQEAVHSILFNENTEIKDVVDAKNIARLSVHIADEVVSSLQDRTANEFKSQEMQKSETAAYIEAYSLPF